MSGLHLNDTFQPYVAKREPAERPAKPAGNAQQDMRRALKEMLEKRGSDRRAGGQRS